MDAKVAVIGCGTMGSMALWHLAQRGVDAIGFEQFGAGHDRGAAGGETKIFRTAYVEGPEYIPLLKDSYRGWRELERQTGHSLLTMTGGLTIGDPEADFMRGLLEGVERFGLEHEVLDPAAARERYPQHRLLPGETMILDHEAGFLRPELAVLAAVSRSEELGATVRRNTRIESIEESSTGLTLHAEDGAWGVERAILTAGPWTAALLPAGHPQLTVHRLVMTWYAAEKPGLFVPERFPVFVRRSHDVDLFGIPSVDGRTVKVALVAGYGEVTDPDDLELRVEPEDLVTINETVRDLIPGLVPEPLRVAAYMDAYTTDGHPVVGCLDGLPSGAVALCGFSGHGFKMAPVMGEIAADLALEGKTRHPVAHLAPDRPTLRETSGRFNKGW